MDMSITMSDIESTRKVLASIRMEIERTIQECVEEGDFDVKYLLRNRRTLGFVETYVEVHGQFVQELGVS